VERERAQEFIPSTPERKRPKADPAPEAKVITKINRGILPLFLFWAIIVTVARINAWQEN